MAVLSRKHLQEEIIVGSDNIWFHPMIAYHRGISNPVILKKFGIYFIYKNTCSEIHCVQALPFTI